MIFRLNQIDAELDSLSKSLIRYKQAYMENKNTIVYGKKNQKSQKDASVLFAININETERRIKQLESEKTRLLIAIENEQKESENSTNSKPPISTSETNQQSENVITNNSNVKDQKDKSNPNSDSMEFFGYPESWY